jgi:hypothetical protein
MTKRRAVALAARLIWLAGLTSCHGGGAAGQDAAAGSSAGASGSGGATGAGGAANGTGGATAGSAGGLGGAGGTATGGHPDLGGATGGSDAGGAGGTGGAGGASPTGSAGVSGNGGTSGSGATAGASGMGGGATAGTSGAAGVSGSGGASGGAAPVAFVDGLEWADTRGMPIQAHGGGVLKVGADYYWFGENRNDDGTFKAVSAYHSRDLRTWDYRNDVLKMTSAAELMPANIERPKVVYNASTKKYVMWMHWENGSDYGQARAAVAVSDTVDGNYTYLGSARPFVNGGVTDHGMPGYMSRDCNLFVDDDGKAYFISATNENTDLNLYLLSSDYLSVSTLAATLFKGAHREAPVIFKRQGVYFMLSSAATGWDPNQAQYATSTVLASGWSALTNVADAHTYYSQPTYVVAVSGTSGTEYLYMGDRWAGAWGGRVNDSAYLWAPISFSSSTTMSMSWVDTLTIGTGAGTVRGAVTNFHLVNKKSGKLLDVAGGSTADGGAVVQNPANASAAGSQDWKIDYDTAGFDRLINKKSGKLLEVPNESTAAGIALDQWTSNGGDHQVWTIVDLGGGAYRVKNKKSGLYVGVVGASTADGAAVEQRASSGGDEQVWLFVPSS